MQRENGIMLRDPFKGPDHKAVLQKISVLVSGEADCDDIDKARRIIDRVDALTREFFPKPSKGTSQ